MRQISIRELAFEVYQSGNITSTNYLLERAQEGTMLHTIRQAEYHERAIKEYYINEVFNYNNEYLNLVGYVDGLLEKDFYLEMEEIKTTALDIKDSKFIYKPEHIAQAKIYAYFLLKNSEFSNITVNLLYIHNKTHERINYKFEFDLMTLEDFLYDTLDRYYTFQNIVREGYLERIKTINMLEFPYINKRAGQEEFINVVEETLLNNDKILIEAPTGIGKTIGSIYGALKNLKSFNDKLFYLTAKNSGAMSAIKAFKVLMNNGLDCHVIEINAKKKMCVNKKDGPKCDKCHLAIDYYAKLRKIIGNILLEHRILTKNIIYNIAISNDMCPFELSLDLSSFSDVIICDYNYVFDPKVKLKRFFEEEKIRPYILCDEAHNLVSRSIEMYSSTFSTLDLKILYKALINYENITQIINNIFNYIEKTYAINFENNDLYYQKDNDLFLESLLIKLLEYINDITEELDEDIKEVVLDYYFNLRDYLRISNIYSNNHILLVKLNNNNYVFNIRCLNANKYLTNTINEETSGIVFFSATLKPFSYYNNYLYIDKMKELELSSPFPKENQLELICPVSTKYKDRYYTLKEIINIIETVIYTKKGKYIVFFPSYEYLTLVVNNLVIDSYELLIQQKGEQLINNKNILDCFKEEGNILGLFVLGGIYSEGIDFIGDLLDGVIVLGVGLPQISKELDIYKDSLDNLGYKGFDYIYTYPGITKVIQASGRVIRDDNDKGIIVLIDDRYKYQKYQQLFPKHWENKYIINDVKELSTKIEDFYKK